MPHMEPSPPPVPMQLSLTGVLASVACVALNLWLFRLGALWGILGLNVTKHVVIATLCQSLGLARVPTPGPPGFGVGASGDPR